MEQLYYLFEDASKGTAIAVHLDLEVLKGCAFEHAQAYPAWVIRAGDGLDAAIVATGA